MPGYEASMTHKSYSWSQRPFTELSSRHALRLLKPAFVKTLIHEFDVAPLQSRMYPVCFADGSVGIFVLEAFRNEDQTLALFDLLEAKSRRLATPGLYVLPPALFLAVAQGDGLSPRAVNEPGAREVLSGALSAVMREVIEWAAAKQASDIHLNVQRHLGESSIWFTIAGRYVCPERYAHIPTATMLDMLAVTWMEVQGGNGAVFDPSVEQEGRFVRVCHGRRYVIRWASLATDVGPSVCLRLLPLDSDVSAPTFAELGYLPSHIEALETARLSQGGAIILAGTVGSGKSTTIASLLRTIPSYRKVITLEDPAEYAIPNALQNTVARSVHDDGLTVFDRKLNAIKRSAMTDLLIGEIRDQAAGRAFVDLAATGVSLYTTVHAGSALLIPERLCSSFIGIPRDFLTAPGVLKLLVYQVLLREVCPHCAFNFEQFLSSSALFCARNITRSVPWWRSWASGIERRFGITSTMLRFCNAAGCDSCQSDIPMSAGTKGRTVVAEMLSMAQDAEIFALLRQVDQSAVHRWLLARTKTPCTDIQMQGKSALECALYKMSVGQIDPREIETYFGVFQTQFNDRKSGA